MFEQSFVPRGDGGRSPAAIAISFGGQAVLVLCLLLAPLLRPQVLRLVMQRSFLEMPRRVQPAPQVVTGRAVVQRPAIFRMSTLTAPVRIPQHVAMITDAAPDVLPGIPASGAVFSVIGDTLGSGEVVKPPVASLPPAAPIPKPPVRLRVSSSMQQAQLITQIRPVYPKLAIAARIAGTVVLQAVIGKDGSIQNLQVVSGPPLLTRAALDAVAQWRYRPTLLSGVPVEVATQIDVNFTLN